MRVHLACQMCRRLWPLWSAPCDSLVYALMFGAFGVARQSRVCQQLLVCQHDYPVRVLVARDAKWGGLS